MKDIMGIMKQARDLQAKMQTMQDELTALEVTGSSGAGLVVVTLNGRGEMRAIKLDPSLIKPDEIEILEDLIVAATQDARAKSEQATQAKMQEATAGLPLPPGMKLF